VKNAILVNITHVSVWIIEKMRVKLPRYVINAVHKKRVHVSWRTTRYLKPKMACYARMKNENGENEDIEIVFRDIFTMSQEDLILPLASPTDDCFPGADQYETESDDACCENDP